ncbi:MAG TPA: hypothetical protein VMW62_08640 [Chloroflexota bacterium]|nr:hypothetical protein [Chloroflexota bacterium]
MTITLVTPQLPEARSGNWITAARYRRILRHLGHRVQLATEYDGSECDALIALHARRSHPSIRRFGEQHPAKPLVVVLTGTDLYRDIHQDQDAQRSLDLASRLVVLQRMGVPELPSHLPKVRVIYQSVSGCHPGRARPPSSYFKVAVVGHLRPEKDSLRTALAARQLPAESRIRVVHAGSALEGQLGEEAREESANNPRYRWIGGIPHWRA